ncbi:hypothetical protein ACOMHN_063130 [Nucella lapillus]
MCIEDPDCDLHPQQDGDNPGEQKPVEDAWDNGNLSPGINLNNKEQTAVNVEFSRRSRSRSKNRRQSTWNSAAGAGPDLRTDGSQRGIQPQEPVPI